IADHMERSWREIPHVTTFDTVAADRLLDLRAALSARYDAPVPIETLVVLAVLPVLVEFAEFNASLDGEDLIFKRRYDIGVAADTPDGLIVPVVKGADRWDPRGLAGEIARLAAAARSRSLAPDELSGATFTISNIGAVGGGHGTPIIPYGTTAILSVGRAEPQAVVRAGSVTIARMMPLSLSYDHRVIDGGLGRRFMARLRENLEEPGLFLAP
ncbi:MAG: 2-oxo acid dehydrogenase subunit E2, partial [Acidimicrobiia bacterium]|nr:2-oxo acid dehydrogenase subunit E2 [Acidimicrobiia bacterium]